MTAAILLPTWRADGDWRDLGLAVHSLAAYAPAVPLLVGWDGPTPPDLERFGHPGLATIHRPPGMSSAQAFWWLTEHTTADQLVMWSDDCVATPTTITHLLDDAQRVGPTLGMLGARSNHAAGAQNIRQANGGTYGGVDWTTEAQVLQVDFLAPYVALTPRTALTHAGPPPDFESFSDNVICDRLITAGLTLAVSRAYVHHTPGSRSLGAAGLTMADRAAAGRRGLDALGITGNAPRIDGSHPRPL